MTIHSDAEVERHRIKKILLERAEYFDCAASDSEDDGDEYTASRQRSMATELRFIVNELI